MWSVHVRLGRIRIFRGLVSSRLPIRVTPERVDRGVRYRVRICRDPRLLERLLVRDRDADAHEPVFPT